MSYRTVLEVSGLDIFKQDEGTKVPIVTDVGFSISAGEAVALVGESGCGKSVTASAIVDLLPPALEATGSIRLNGQEVSNLRRRERRKLCGKDIGFIFQEPMTSLHPTLSIGRQMTDTLRHNLALSKAAALNRAADLLDQVGIPRPRTILGNYVHELSGGMRQRVMIAMAVSCGPSLIIADEPTTALDVTIQVQILELLHTMRDELDLAILFISHDLDVVSDFCERAIVMYAGEMIELADVDALMTRPRHPYTRGLLDASPGRVSGADRLNSIPGQVPQVGDWPPGCRFRNRCAHAVEVCGEHPILDGASARCWFPLGDGRE